MEKTAFKSWKGNTFQFCRFQKATKTKSLLKPGCQPLFNLRYTILTLIYLDLPVSQANKSTDISETHPLYKKYSCICLSGWFLKIFFSKMLTYLWSLEAVRRTEATGFGTSSTSFTDIQAGWMFLTTISASVFYNNSLQLYLSSAILSSPIFHSLTLYPDLKDFCFFLFLNKIFLHRKKRKLKLLIVFVEMEHIS